MKIVKNGKIIMNDEIVEGLCLLFDKKIISLFLLTYYNKKLFLVSL